MLTIKEEAQPSIVEEDTAYDLWNSLEEQLLPTTVEKEAPTTSTIFIVNNITPFVKNNTPIVNYAPADINNAPAINIGTLSTDAADTVNNDELIVDTTYPTVDMDNTEDTSVSSQL
ncbi:hypothetical protein M9H77_14110 [Catharanthus roseus]|uniref:Uncharacterized protein n=1 Tax=Catharanthus roseus TaxID=4058 RepID=A0ACC0BM79_CATRO|nr:hypothetical protein M9H77_14110 [Catharanthus roseus]